MDNRKNFRWTVLLFILILLVAASLFISRMSGSHAQKQDTDTEMTVEETLPREGMTVSETFPESTETEEAESTKDAVSEDSGTDTSAAEEDATPDEALAEAVRKREEDERYVEYRRNIAAKSREKEKEKESPQNCGREQEEEVPKEEPYVPPTIMIVSDLHYLSSDMHDNGEAFWKMVMTDDGKLTPFSDLILEALIDEAIERNVSAVVFAGDNTFDGEMEDHIRLAQSLRRLTDAGIAVLIVPGNHDINNTNAVYYFGDETEDAEYLHSADEYYEIYADFYEGANSRDPFSLSYVYPLDETHWMMLLDSAWYEDRMHVDGRIRPETLLWMEEVFEAAEEAGATIIPVAHHNLLSESRVYTKECIMQNADEVTELLESYRVPVFLSGHLHAQRIKKHKSQPGVSDEEYGLTEIVSSPVSIAPCQYGILSWDEDDSIHYEVYSLTDHMDETGNHINMDEMTDPEEGTVFSDEETVISEEETVISEEESISTDEDAGYEMTFEPIAEAFTKMVIITQVQYQFPNLPMEISERIGECYADMYYLYCSGSYIDWDAFRRSEGYALLQKYTRSDEYIKDIYEMSQDNTTDYHRWDYP